MNTPRIGGFTPVETLVAPGIIVLLAGFLLPTLTDARRAANAKCLNNLRQIDGAKQQWALENKQPADAVVVMQQILPYLSHNGTLPTCPSGGVYTLNAIDAVPTCSIAGHALPQ